MKLNEKAMLVSLSISYWTGKASDDRVVEEITRKHQTASDAHEYKKVLLHPDAINKVKAARTRARTFFFEKTSPWIDGGTRMLAAVLYMDVAKKMHEFRGEYETAVSELIRNYSKLKGEARKRLGNLYRDEDYPSEAALRKKFGWEMKVFPIPSDKDFRLDLGTQATAEIRKQIEESVKAAAAVATKDLWVRLHDVVSALADKMREADPTFRDSIIGNIKDLCALLPKMNIADDPRLEELRRKVEVDLSTLNLGELREDKKARKKAVDAADELLKKMAGYIGEQ
jgi:hypothetical protein